ncbi:MAG: RnfABCDGE type electron transport complex subunit D [Lachnospiraceae bacterium]|nr:RnfABCDGE type electron transport complex subunit D [Lachnospiraceae bacterium]
MSDMMNVSANPHIRSKDSTTKIMLLVIIALLPATGFGIYNFGLNAAILVCTSVATCVLTEFLYEKLMKLPLTIGDLSAVVTGLLLGLNLPPAAPFWLAMIGGVFAILVVKMLFGGIGQNFMNPALGARCFLMISFTARMTTFTYDGVTTATPLAMLKAGEDVNTWNMVVGTIPGTIGETSVIAILAGAVFLILFDVIDMRIPFTYLLTFVLFIGLFGPNGWDPWYLTAQLAGGGLMLGAFFMATDYATSPMTHLGKIIYGVILGILTGIFRVFSSSAEGVSYAIIISNLLVPLIERFTIPKCFGKGVENR